MVEIPRNTRDTSESEKEKIVKRCVEAFEKGLNCVSISWQETTEQIALEIASMFVAKGYHASEYHVRGKGWSTVDISTYRQDASSAPMSYTSVLG